MAEPTVNVQFSSRRHSALVFVDGVEIPWLSLKMTSSLGSGATAEIYVEPDEIIEEVRPKSYVHIFLLDPNFTPKGQADLDEAVRDTDFVLNNFYLFFEGEVQGINENESSQSKSMVLMCSDLMNIIMNTTLELVMLNNGINIPTINGSTFYGDFITDGGDSSALAFILLSAMGYSAGTEMDVKKIAEDKTAPDTKPRTLKSVVAKAQNLASTAAFISQGLVPQSSSGQEYFFHDAVRMAVKYLTRFNASFRLQAMRTRLFDKIYGIPDQTFKNLISRRTAALLVDSGFGNVPRSSLGELMQYTLSLGLHTNVSVFFPKSVDVTNGFWNQYLFLPNLYYGIPPSCNWLFPEHINTLSTNRFFSQEPTRLGVKDPLVGVFGLMHMAPSSLTDVLKLTKERTPAEVVASTTATTTVNTRSEADLDLVNYRVNPADNESYNLLKSLAPAEIEKGVVFKYSDISTEYFAGSNKLTGIFSADAQEGAAVKGDLETQIKEQSPYIKYAAGIANYRLAIEQMSREISLSGPFNPWATPGFPALVCRKDRGFRGLLASVTHVLTANGDAQTSYQLVQTTKFRPKAGMGISRNLSEQSGLLGAALKRRDKAISDYQVASAKLNLPNGQIRSPQDNQKISKILLETRSSVDKWPKQKSLTPFVDILSAAAKELAPLTGVSADIYVKALRLMSQTADQFSLYLGKMEIRTGSYDPSNPFFDVAVSGVLDAGTQAYNEEFTVKKDREAVSVDGKVLSLTLDELTKAGSNAAHGAFTALWDSLYTSLFGALKGVLYAGATSTTAFKADSLARGTIQTGGFYGLSQFLFEEFFEIFESAIIDDSELQAAIAEYNKVKADIVGAVDPILQTGTDVTPVFPFANPKLLDPAMAESIYSETIGIRETVKKYSSGAISGIAENLEATDPALVSAMSKEFESTAIKIFPFDSSVSTDEQNAPLYTKWQKTGDVHAAMAAFGGLDKEKLVSMRQFLKKTVLDIVRYRAQFGPSVSSFFVLEAPAFSTSSYFDKILPPAGVFSDQQVSKDLADMADSELNKKAAFLKEAGRQEILINYSKKHFVSRGFSGK